MSLWISAILVHTGNTRGAKHHHLDSSLKSDHLKSSEAYILRCAAWNKQVGATVDTQASTLFDSNCCTFGQKCIMRRVGGYNRVEWQLHTPNWLDIYS